VSAGAELIARLDEAAAFVRGKSALRPVVGLVLGSGLGAFAETLADATSVPYATIPHFPTSTAVGHKGELVIGRSGGVPVAVMAGRVHFYEGYNQQQVVFPVRVLGRLGVTTLIVTNAAGGINTAYRPGDLMVIEDHINFMGTNPMIGENPPGLGERFFDMSTAYDPALRDAAAAACREAGVAPRRGVYIAMTGPSYETPAEIRMARALGADAVGMSTVPEVIAARHMGLRVAGLSCITNAAAGVLPQALSHTEVLETGERMKATLLTVLAGLVRAAAGQ
jgi:purine-nucleoside phosphorylase